jgi:tRNA threonylcarbamoyladenosine biosynthesis protein TsaE
MQELNFSIEQESELPAAAAQLLAFAGDRRVFLFDAEMGTGKTTFIKVLCQVLKSDSAFSSPSYSIVNEYKYPGGKIFHFDLYRLKQIDEALDLGIEDYLYSGNYCFVEWPNLLEQTDLPQYVKLEISISNNIRYFRASLN